MKVYHAVVRDGGEITYHTYRSNMYTAYEAIVECIKRRYRVEMMQHGLVKFEEFENVRIWADYGTTFRPLNYPIWCEIVEIEVTD